MITQIPRPKLPRNGPSAVEPREPLMAVPVLDDSMLSKYRADKKPIVQQKYARLFNFWVNGSEFRRETEIGYDLLTSIWRCRNDMHLLHIIMDDLDKFTNDFLSFADIENQDDLRALHKYMRFSFICGAEKVGEALMSVLNYYPTDPNHDEYEYENTLAAIGSSGNIEWIKTILHRNDDSTIPSYAYRFATTD